jgi:ribosomal protein S18 acetylase RimI-like enzyme
MGDVDVFNMRYVSKSDKSFWFTLDNDIRDLEFELKVRDKRGYIINEDGKPVGIIRYNLLWDNMPFLTLICIVNACHGNGYGRQAMLSWENEMKEAGYKMVMTSTRVDEEAQHFYRKLGYMDRGSIFLDRTPLEQPQEMFMLKIL